LILHGSLFGFDFIFNTIPEKHIFWDWDVFDSTEIKFFLGTTDCRTGESVWFDKSHINRTVGLDAARASCSVPMVSKIVRYDGRDLLDGGISAAIPIKKSMEDGNRFHVVILTRNKGYSKKPSHYKGILKLFYGQYPKLVEAMEKRHILYNEQLALCERLEREGKALIIRPLEPLAVGRTGRNIDKLLRLYDEGHREGDEAVKILTEKLKTE